MNRTSFLAATFAFTAGMAVFTTQVLHSQQAQTGGGMSSSTNSYASTNYTSSTMQSSTSRSSSSQQATIVDLSILLDSSPSRVAANGNIVFTVKVKNVGGVATNGSFQLLRNDMTYVSATGGSCSVPSDSTYLDCSTVTISGNSTGTMTITMRASASFTCTNSLRGRSTFAFMAGRDQFSQNDTSNIVNTLPVCP